MLPSVGLLLLYLYASCVLQVVVSECDEATDDYCIRLVNGTGPWEGRLEVHHDRQWGTVCYRHYTLTSSLPGVVCRELGYTGGEIQHTALYGDGSGVIWLRNVYCHGTEERLVDCEHSRWGGHEVCRHIYDADIACTTVRLAGSDNLWNGHVEVSHNGVWRGVCGDGWNDLNAAVVCRELDYMGGVAWTQDYVEATSNTVWLDDVVCSGTEKYLGLCDHGGWGNYDCENNTYAAVTCSLGVRLVDGTFPWEGWLEVYHDGQWGTVCYDEYSIMRIRLAAVVCRELGFSGGEVQRTALIGEGSGVTRRGNVYCAGTEEKLVDCQQSWWDGHDECRHHLHIGIACITVQLTSSDNPWKGRVEVSHNGVWRGVCGDGWNDLNAAVVCRELHYIGGVAWTDNDYDETTSNTVWLDDVVCNGTERYLGVCSHAGWGNYDCESNTYAAVTCNASIRLVDGPGPWAGRVEMWHNEEWGTVCGDVHSWDGCSADRVCRKLGYNGGEAHHQAAFGEGNGTIWYSNVYFYEYTDGIFTCMEHSWGLSSASCGHDRDAGLSCIAVRLANGDSPTEGRVEIFYNGVWRGVCGDGWNDLNAAVVCRELHYIGGVAWTDNDYDETTSNTVWLDDVVCNGTERYLGVCSHAGWGNYDCESNTYAGATCDNTVRLINGTGPWEGRIEVFDEGDWGTVNSHGWNTLNVHVVCRELGYNSGGEVHLNAAFGEGSGEILRRGVACIGTEERLRECFHYGWWNYEIPGYIDHSGDAGVSCTAECSTIDRQCMSCMAGRCTRCGLGYVPTDDQNHCIECSTAIPNCKVCSSTNCRACMQGFAKTVDGKQCEPVNTTVHTLSPLYGPVAGGTHIIITGTYLTIWGEPTIYYWHRQQTTTLCQVHHSSDAEISCITNELENPAYINTELSLGIEWLQQNLTQILNYTFTYKANPQVFTLYPLDAIAKGGTKITVTGISFTSVTHPELLTTVVKNNTGEERRYQTGCDIRSSVEMQCDTPDISDFYVISEQSTDKEEDANMKHEYTIYLGLQLDGVRTYRDLRTSNISQYSRLTIHQNPTLEPFKDSPVVLKTWWPHSVHEITVMGTQLHTGGLIEQYDIRVANTSCDMRSAAVTDNSIVFLPPEHKPHVEGGADEMDVMLYLGTNIALSPGTVVYHTSILACRPCTAGLFVSIAVVCTVCILVAIVFFWKHKNANKQDDVSSDTQQNKPATKVFSVTKDEPVGEDSASKPITDEYYGTAHPIGGTHNRESTTDPRDARYLEPCTSGGDLPEEDESDGYDKLRHTGTYSYYQSIDDGIAGTDVSDMSSSLRREDVSCKLSDRKEVLTIAAPEAVKYKNIYSNVGDM